MKKVALVLQVAMMDQKLILVMAVLLLAAAMAQKALLPTTYLISTLPLKQKHLMAKTAFTGILLKKRTHLWPEILKLKVQIALEKTRLMPVIRTKPSVTSLKLWASDHALKATTQRLLAVVRMQLKKTPMLLVIQPKQKA